jgi:hypothetical protein
VKLWSAAAQVVVAIIVVGCGGPSDAERAGAVVKEWLRASAEGDHRKACALMTTAGQRSLVSDLAYPSVRTCRDAIRHSRRDMPLEVRQLLIAGIEIERVDVQGARATVHPREIASFFLVRVDGTWKITRIGDD